MRQSLAYMLAGFVTVLVLAFAVKKIISPKSGSFKDFLIDEQNKYSLSHFQASLWALVIISTQISTLIFLAVNHSMDSFKLVFSEETIWLLGISLGSFITVKGIKVSQMANSNALPSSMTNPTRKTDLSDLIMTKNRLDLSRFQMFVWTIIATVVYLSSYAHYLLKIISSSHTGADLSMYFPQFSDDTSILPTIDMSFIVLMGISQGAYIGRKLVPDYKVNEFTNQYTGVLDTQSSALEDELKDKLAALELLKASPTFNGEGRDLLEKDISFLQQKLAAIAYQKQEAAKNAAVVNSRLAGG